MPRSDMTYTFTSAHSGCCVYRGQYKETTEETFACDGYGSELGFWVYFKSADGLDGLRVVDAGVHSVGLAFSKCPSC